MGLKDILASKGKRRILTKMFRPPIFANTIFSQSFNLGGFLALFRFGIMFTPSSCLWACDRHFQVWGGGSLYPFWCWGSCQPPFLGLGNSQPPFLGLLGCQPLLEFGVLVGFSVLHQPHFIQSMHFSRSKNYLFPSLYQSRVYRHGPVSRYRSF